MAPTTNTVFVGCAPEVACAPGGAILAVGSEARRVGGRGARRIELAGTALPGLGDAHLHLEWLARSRHAVDLTGARTRQEALRRVRRFAAGRPSDAWISGQGWFNDLWGDDPGLPTRQELDSVTAGRPAVLTRKDGHSAWLNTAALNALGFRRGSRDPERGVIDRDRRGEPSGVVREAASAIARRAVPAPSEDDFTADLAATLRDLARRGLTTVHTMDSAHLFGSLQRLHDAGRLPIRVVWNFPQAELAAALAMGIRSGYGDLRLRVWGMKGFLDGSLGSRTAEMLDGGGVTGIPQGELVELVRLCAQGGLNVCLHAIGDRAVRRALDALLPFAGAGRLWRPRIEHAQCVHRDDLPRFAEIGVIASMQPLHAVSDRELAERLWPDRQEGAYAWGALARCRARLAFGSDAPVESASPLLGLDAATGWRRRTRWYPELALTRAAALRAYSHGVAYAAGMEGLTGRLRPGLQCDLTVVDGTGVLATVVGGEVAWLGSQAA
ncbi:MAG: amidohydrolase [Candidatus Dormibacteria bacterium]